MDLSFAKSLMFKQACSSLLVALVPVLIVGFMVFANAKSALEKTSSEKLLEATQQRQVHLKDYLHQTVLGLKFLARHPSVRAFYDQLSVGEAPGATASERAGGGTSARAVQAAAELGSVFRSWLDLYASEFAYDDILVMDSGGRVVYTEKKLSDLGESVKSGALQTTGLAALWKKIMDTEEQAMVDFSDYHPSGAPAAFCGVPAYDQNGMLSGVLALRLGSQQINTIFQAGASTGKTEEVRLVGEDQRLRSTSRVSEGGNHTKKVDTMAARAALMGATGAGLTKDERGEPVLCAYTPLGIKSDKALGADFEWAVVAEVSSGEALGAVSALQYRILLVAALVAVVVVVVALFMARAVAMPIRSLARHAASVSVGDLRVEIPELKRGDELGALGRAFGTMVASLRDQTGKTADAVNYLASSASKISAAISQLAASVAKASAAVSETTASIEEVKQAAQMAGEKAKLVAESSREVVHVSESGQKATQESIEKINLIKQQMESIGETVVRLSDHSQAVVTIIDSVKDLADQSNLLAVNASIEAARAGDLGKGFAVVAYEIKSLAEQSRIATDEVRTILDQTRALIGAVVMATEQGNKAVCAGAEQSVVAGDCIQSLGSSIVQSSQAATLIDVSSRQQVLGIDQVSRAMTNIHEAMFESVQGTTELETEARNLAHLGTELQKLVEQYRV